MPAQFEAGARRPRRPAALAVLLTAVALTLTSVTSVNVALPAIREGICASSEALSLVLTGYALAFGLVLVPAGRYGDRRSHQRVFVSGVALFTAVSAWCGLAPDETQLVVARVLAGGAAGLAVTPVTALIQVLYAPEERTGPFAAMGAVFGVSTAIGPLVGGLLVDLGRDIGWRGEPGQSEEDVARSPWQDHHRSTRRSTSLADSAQVLTKVYTGNAVGG